MVVLLKAFNPAWGIKVGTVGISIATLVGVIAASVTVSVLLVRLKPSKIPTESK